MWRNRDVARFTDWLRAYNRDRPDRARAGFHGLDLYSLDSSIHAVLEYLDRVDPEAAAVARRRYGCLMPWSREPAQYGRMALSAGYAPCEKAVVQTLRELLSRRLEYASHDGECFLDAAQNARLVSSAEAYYRAMYYGSAESWNLRDRHMFETLEHLLAAGGPDSRAVVWAHNSHIGDARHTEMGKVREELNLGQLCRQRFGQDVALVGFGTHAGTVAAADEWDAPMQVMDVRPSRSDSYERLFHDAGQPRCLLDLREGAHPEVRDRLLSERLERFIGVIYRPGTERWSHYVECSLPRQFDAYVWFDETGAVEPLAEEPRSGMAETWPFGM
jgi:erythromycin esterase-like protein